MAFTVVGPPPHPPLGVPRAAAVGDCGKGPGVPGPLHVPLREAVAAAQLGLAGGLPAVPAGRMGGFPRAGADLGAQTHPQAEVGVGVMGRRVEHRGVRRGVQAAGGFPRSAASAPGVEGDPPDPTYTCQVKHKKPPFFGFTYVMCRVDDRKRNPRWSNPQNGVGEGLGM